MAAAMLSGTVFADLNGNGAREATETALAGFSVDLLAADGSGSVLATVKTDVNGTYAFASIAGGTYAVRFTPPTAGYRGSAGTTGTDGRTLVTNLSVPGNAATVFDEGFSKAGTIAGIVFTDANGNGAFNAGEVLTNGVDVKLYNDIGVLLATTTSSNKDAFRPGTSGVYSFQNLAPGTYTVSVTAPDGKVTSGASTLTESVTSGAVLSSQNFGVKNNPPTVSLSGTIFGDADGNGLQSASEGGIRGASLLLRDAVTGDTLKSTVTDSAGHYSFGTTAGSYLITVATPAGLKGTVPTTIATGSVADGASNPQLNVGFAADPVSDKTDAIPGTTVLNVVLRGQSNTYFPTLYGNLPKLKAAIEAQLGFDGVQQVVNVIGTHDNANGANTEWPGTGMLTDWLTPVNGDYRNGWTANQQEIGLLNTIGQLPAAQRAAPTAIVWLHNENDSQNTNLTTAMWESAVRYEAGLVRGVLGQDAATVPYLFVNAIPFPAQTAGVTRTQPIQNQAIRVGQAELTEDKAFNAGYATHQASDVNMDVDGHGITRQPGSVHFDRADADLIFNRIALSVAEEFKASARPGSPMALAGGDIDDDGPHVVRADRVAGAANQLLLTVEFDQATAIKALGSAAAAGTGWSLRPDWSVGTSQVLATRAEIVDASHIRLDLRPRRPRRHRAVLRMGRRPHRPARAARHRRRDLRRQQPAALGRSPRPGGHQPERRPGPDRGPVDRRQRHRHRRRRRRPAQGRGRRHPGRPVRRRRRRDGRARADPEQRRHRRLRGRVRNDHAALCLRGGPRPGRAGPGRHRHRPDERRPGRPRRQSRRPGRLRHGDARHPDHRHHRARPGPDAGPVGDDPGDLRRGRGRALRRHGDGCRGCPPERRLHGGRRRGDVGPGLRPRQPHGDRDRARRGRQSRRPGRLHLRGDHHAGYPGGRGQPRRAHDRERKRARQRRRSRWRCLAGRVGPVGFRNDLRCSDEGSVTVASAHGALTIESDGHYTYLGRSAGSDTFTYSVADGRGGSASAVLTATVASAAPATDATFAFAFAQASLTYRSGDALLTGPDGVVHDVTGIGHLHFTDGTIDEADGSPLVDDLFYSAANPDVWEMQVDPDQHYAQSGWREGRDPNPLFSTSGYLAANPDVARAGIDPLAHYDEFGWREGRNPSPSFDTKAYLAGNPDVAAAGVDPLAHYLEFGRTEGRTEAPVSATAPIPPTTPIVDQLKGDFDATYYLDRNPDVARAAAASGVAPDSFAFTHYLQFGAAEGRDPDAYFSTKGYLAAYPDVAAAGLNPMLHYEDFGWREGRNPSALFDTQAYLAANPDVAAAGIDPLAHYLRYGILEHRDLA